jgi:cytidylate kinase
MAEDIKVSVRFVETLDERGLNTLENLVASLVDERYLWPDQYMKHLMKVIGTIGMHGKSIIVGRGANFILQQDKRISVRIYAPFDARARSVAERSGISMEEAKRQIINTESQRRSFVRKYFNASISDLNNYDLALNTGTLGIERTVDAITAVCPATGG